MLKKNALMFSLLLAVLAFLLFNSQPTEAAIAPPISSDCSWTSGDTYSCGGSTTSTYTCTNSIKSTTSKCSTDCGSASSCGGASPGQWVGCSADKRGQTCSSSCQLVTGVCDYPNCGAHANCDAKTPGSAVAGGLCSDGKPYKCDSSCNQYLDSTCSSSCSDASSSCDGITPGSYTSYCNNEEHRKQYCDSGCTIQEGTICCNGDALCNSYSPGKTYCQSTTNKQQTCNNNCGLDTATSCVKDVCGAECVAGDTTTTGCSAGQEKSCDTSSCKWGACGLTESTT